MTPTLKEVCEDIKTLTDELNETGNIQKNLKHEKESISKLNTTISELENVKSALRAKKEVANIHAEFLLNNLELLEAHLYSVFNELVAHYGDLKPSFWTVPEPNIDKSDFNVQYKSIELNVERPKKTYFGSIKEMAMRYHHFRYFRLESAMKRHEYLSEELRRLRPLRLKLQSQLEQAQVESSLLKIHIAETLKSIEQEKNADRPMVSEYKVQAMQFFEKAYHRMLALKHAGSELSSNAATPVEKQPEELIKLSATNKVFADITNKTFARNSATIEQKRSFLTEEPSVFAPL